MNNYFVTIRWPAQGRERYGHGYYYLVLDCHDEKEAAERVEGRWAGKQGGANPHETTVLGQVMEGIHLFRLAELPEECR